ncbi:sugar phosphate isomerase/epimerase family protein [Chloroflexota bacterium]
MDLPGVKLVIEYKPKEPRTHCFIGTVGKTLLLVEKVDKPNVGAMIDVGHALMAYENAAESAAMLQYFGQKLFYMHFNDNWRLWDDDMTVGSVHTVEMLELLYWLDRMDYEGWYALDIFPYREDGTRAATESIRWIKGLHGLLDKIGRDRIGEVVASGDAMEASAMIREFSSQQLSQLHIVWDWTGLVDGLHQRVACLYACVDKYSVPANAGVVKGGSTACCMDMAVWGSVVRMWGCRAALATGSLATDLLRAGCQTWLEDTIPHKASSPESISP